MAYANVADLAARWRPLEPEEVAMAAVLLDDAQVIIDDALGGYRRPSDAILRIVSCDIVRRAMCADGDSAILGQADMDDAMAWTPREAAGSTLWLTYDNKRMLGVFRGHAYSIRPMIGGADGQA